MENVISEITNPNDLKAIIEMEDEVVSTLKANFRNHMVEKAFVKFIGGTALVQMEGTLDSNDFKWFYFESGPIAQLIKVYPEWNEYQEPRRSVFEIIKEDQGFTAEQTIGFFNGLMGAMESFKGGPTPERLTIIQSKAQVKELDWEVPGVHIDRWETSIYHEEDDTRQNILNIFQKFNKVMLQDEALDYFNEAWEDFYRE